MKKTEKAFKPDGHWDKLFWQSAETLNISNFMGGRPEHFPNVQARLLYDSTDVYVIFRVQDRYIRAVSRKYNDSVWCDSCVEFFFTPGTDISLGYFNLETNCGGVMLMCHQLGRGVNCRLVDESDAGRIMMYHSLPERIEPEITAPAVWTLEYKLPTDILAKYAPVEQPVPGVIWRANFYKCGDQTSHPHWLTWSPIDKPAPDFHRPEFFGELVFE